MKKSVLGVAVALVAALFIGCENPGNGNTYSFKKPTLPESVGDNPFVGKSWDQTERGGKLRYSFVSNNKVKCISYGMTDEILYESVLSYSYDTEKSKIYMCYEIYQGKTFDQLVNRVLSFSNQELFDALFNETYTDEEMERIIDYLIDDGTITVSKDASFNQKIAALKRTTIQNTCIRKFEETSEATYVIDGNSLAIDYSRTLMSQYDFSGLLVTTDYKICFNFTGYRSLCTSVLVELTTLQKFRVVNLLFRHLYNS